MATAGPIAASNSMILQLAIHLYKNLCKDITLVQTEGLFRVSGDHEKIQQMRKELLPSSSLPKMSAVNIHDVIGYFKSLLNDYTNCEADKERDGFLLDFQVSMDQKSDDLSQIFFDYIDALGASQFREQNETAQIIYTMVRIAQVVSQHNESNRMNSNNCAMVFGPRILQIIGIFPSAKASFQVAPAGFVSGDEIAVKQIHFNKMIQQAIESDFFSISFKEKYQNRQIAARMDALTDVQHQTNETLQRSKIFISQFNRARRETRSLKEAIAESKERAKNRTFITRLKGGDNLSKKDKSQVKILELTQSRAEALKVVATDSRKQEEKYKNEISRIGLSINRLSLKDIKDPFDSDDQDCHLETNQSGTEDFNSSPDKHTTRLT